MRWMKLEPIKQSEVTQNDNDRYNILTHVNDNSICRKIK